LERFIHLFHLLKKGGAQKQIHFAPLFLKVEAESFAKGFISPVTF
jgi:hypothetical protein